MDWPPGSSSGAPQAEIIESLPGMGPILGAELIAATGDLGGYANTGRLVSAAGLVPVPRDSGRHTGNLHRPMRSSRKLGRVFLLSARSAMMREGPNRDYYLMKRGQGHGHIQALIALARRRGEQVIAELKDGPIAHPPSGSYAANAAWLAHAVIALNLARTAASWPRTDTPALAGPRSAPT